MDKSYNRKELQEFTIIKLKAILKNKQLKINGNKDELIERILESQPSNYLNLLPKDVMGMVSQYQIRNNPNNVLFQEIITNKYIIEDQTLKYKQKLTNFVKNINQEDIITDAQIAQFLTFLVREMKVDAAWLNILLEDLQTDFRIVIEGSIQDSYFDYYVIKGKVFRFKK